MATPPASAPPASTKARPASKSLSFATMIPLVVVHGLSFIAFIIYLAGLAAVENSFRKNNATSTQRANVTAFPWLLLVAYVVAMSSHAVVMVVPHLHFLKLFVALLLAIVISWFGKSLDDTMGFTRNLKDVDNSYYGYNEALSSSRCLVAGGVLCVLCLLAALALVAVNYASSTAAAAPAAPAASAPYTGPVGGEVPPAGMRQAVCPKCGGVTNYPPEYDAVCCASCGTVIQVGAAAV